jgi:hypothetical protein
MILDPVRREVHYGALGLMCQMTGEMVVGIEDEQGRFAALPLGRQGRSFFNVDQWQTMTSVFYEASCPECGVRLRMRITAPFWPRDERTSLVPAYIVSVRLERLDKVRWSHAGRGLRRKGRLRFGLKFPGVKCRASNGSIFIRYPVRIGQRHVSGEGGARREYRHRARTTPVDGGATDMIVPISGGWKAARGMLEATFDVRRRPREFTLAIVGYCGDALFERLGRPMKLKYASMWKGAQDVSRFVKRSYRDLLEKSRAFDAIWSDSSLPAAVQDLAALSFQSYLMNTMWTVGEDGDEWYSVWEGSCWYNSTVDVTYNEAMFYFACWPQLLEMVFEQWSHHANDFEAEKRRRAIDSDDDEHGNPLVEFPGAILQHDMGAGWTANGQIYRHAMPVEENSDFLLLLYAHGKWWGRESLFRKYSRLNAALAEYLLWTDTTGNGFPDRGTANTIDDATPAVQYGRDNVYLGVKRLAALHAAARMLECAGETKMAQRCRREVRRAVRTLNAGWLGDHWGVCLDKSAAGLVDCWTGKPLPYRVLPGWDAYSLYTTNGLVYLMMIGDLPAGIPEGRLRQDVLNACRASMTRYGCGHSSLDKENMWVSMNVWRDCAAGYLGENLLDNCQRYWNQQLFANGVGSEKANCFTETSLTNNLVWYPRNAAVFGLTMSTAGLIRDGGRGTASVRPIAPGRWPLLPLARWRSKRVPVAVAERRNGKLVTKIEGPAAGVKVAVRR